MPPLRNDELFENDKTQFYPLEEISDLEYNGIPHYTGTIIQ